MKKQNPRQIALDIINDVLMRGSFANLSLKYGLADQDVDDADKRLISVIVYGTLDHLGRIDYVLSRFIDARKTSGLILNILRISVFQLMFLDKVPDYSVCSEAVSLTKACTNQKMGNFVNAVLRNVIRQLDKIEYPTERTEYLSVMYSYPRWIVELWIRDYGAETAEKMLSYEMKKHLISIRPNFLRLSRATFERALAPRVSVMEKGRFADNCYYVNAAGISDSELYQEGFYTIQSESSMLCARAASPAPGSTVLDACSAPGGKAMYMAEIMRDEGRVVACDLFEHKTEL
ncbi:MAG: hypothetical protein KIG36_04745, partial [Eubacteriales bacterium]|nr:hypothetical protein [Eubacteriales bacterium]